MGVGVGCGRLTARRAARLGRGRLGPARVSCLRGRRGSGVKAGPQGRREAMRSSLDAGGAAPYARAARRAVSGGEAATIVFLGPRVFGGAVPRHSPRPGVGGCWSWRTLGRGGPGPAGAAAWPVALAVQEQVVAGVDDPVQDRLADHRVGKQRVPVCR